VNELETLPNIGKVLAQKLNEIGIFTAADLQKTGSEKAFIKLSTIDNSACINMLYALEGAIQEIRWHQLSKERKSELLEFFHFCNSKN